MANTHLAARRPLVVGAHAATQVAKRPPALTRGLTLLFAATVGVIVLPLYAPQPLIEPIGSSLGFSLSTASLIAMTPMLGYATGLVLLVPLIDLIENRRAILLTLLANVVALACAAAAQAPALFLLAAFAGGCTTSALQMVVPVVANRVDEAQRGRIIGNVMSGLMIGILLSRPIASLAAATFGWRGAYAIDAIAVAAVVLALQQVLPRSQPAVGGTYHALIASLWMLLVKEPVLRRRALYQGLCMAAFGIFWTGIALRLAAPPFELGSVGIAVFTLAGAGGAIVAPLAGWAGDRGYTIPATLLAHATVIAALLLAGVAGAGWFGFDPTARPALSLALLAAAAIALDFGVIGDQTLGRRAVQLACAKASGRLNGLYTGLFFVGGSIGSALTGIAWVEVGWTLICAVGIGCVALALALASTEQPNDGRAHHIS